MPVAWSYSRLTKYEQCQWKSYCMDYAPKHARVVEPPSPVFEKGKQYHKSMENAIRIDAPLPEHLAYLSPLVRAIRGFQNVYVEQQVAFSEDLNLVDWFDKQVWCRVIWDAAGITADGTEAFCIDWKSGRVRSESDQLELFGASMMTRFPSVQRVHTSFNFLEHGKYTWHTLHRQSLPHIWHSFGERANMIAISQETGNWEPTPGKHCEWCPVPKSKCSYSFVDG